MIGDHEVAADQCREGEHAAGLDVVGVGAEGTEQRAQIIHPPIVDASEPLSDRRLSTSPVAHGEVDRQQPVAEGERARAPQLGADVAAPGLDALDHLLGARPLPRVEHLVEQCAPVFEMPVEAAPGDAGRLG